MPRSEALKKAQKKYYESLKADTPRYDEFKRNNRDKLKIKKDKLESDTKKNKETVKILMEENEKLKNQLDELLKQLSLKIENKE
jgi:microsomal dipeptidase-like Zn-dependent dipeptidase